MNEIGSPPPENIRYISLPESVAPPIPERFEVKNLLWSERYLWVYEVWDRRTPRTARLWVEQVFSNFEQYFTRSLGLLKLSHPNLWPVYDSFEYTRANTRYRAILVAAPGPTDLPLRALMAGSVSVHIAGQICRQLGLALIYCHSQKTIHGHLQPAFVWVNPAGTVRLEMFAALPRRPESKLALANWNSESSPGFLGTAYTSPEQFLDLSKPGPPGDVYALGIIAYELLAGFNPFLGNSDFASQVRQAYRAVPPLSQINPAVGPGLEAAIAGAMVKNPGGRYPTVIDFLSRFEIGLVSDLQNQAIPQAYQTMAQLLEQARSMAAETVNFASAPSLTSEPAASPTASATGPEPSRPSPTEPEVVIQQPLPHPAAQPSQPAPPPPPAKAGREGRLTPLINRARLFKPVHLVPVILVLNLFLMAFLSGWLLNNPNSSQPVVITANPTPGVSVEYPTIEPAELTRLAQAATTQAGFVFSPTLPEFTLPGTSSSPAVTTPSLSSGPLTTLPPVPTQQTGNLTQPLTSPALVPTEVPAAALPAPGPAFSFSPPDNFTGSDTSANPQAAADRAFFEEAGGQQALAVYQADLARNPSDEATLRRLGRFLYLWGHPTQPDAITILVKALALNKNDALAWAYLSFVYFGNYEYAKGENAASQAVALAPDLPEAQAAKALSLLYTGQPSIAVGEITRLAGLSYPNLNFWVYLARFKIIRADGDLSGALTLLDNLQNSFPGVVGFYCDRAEILWTLGPGSYAEAQSLLQKALRLDPDHYCIHSNLGWVYYLQGDPAQAKKEFDLALQYNSRDTLALTGTGYILIDRQDFSGAQAVLQKAVQLEPFNGRAFNGLAVVSLNMGDNANALDWANKALQVMPGYADAYYNAGRAYFSLGNFQAAVTSLQKAITLNPSAAAYFEALAYSYYRLNDNSAAIQAARDGLILQPNNPALQDLLKKLGAD